ncbi:MAG: hypothetical protein JSV34_00315 [Candidatus Omnitrophota bacterium]|nr:MAG: hypothetical protein JSV34_00315 [Candidatus Omnitrophota bacterium]
MRKLYFLLAGLGIGAVIGCSAPPQGVLIDSFEGDINARTVDYGAGQGSSLKVEADKSLKVCGSQSLKLDYDLKPSSYMWIARGYNLDVAGAAKWLVKPSEVAWEKYNAISIYMYGGNSDAVIAFDIKDAQGEFWRFIIDDDFGGWKEIICPFSQFFVRGDWQPESATRNEVLDFPIMSFQFEPRMPGEGRCNFDCVKVVK